MGFVVLLAISSMLSGGDQVDDADLTADEGTIDDSEEAPPEPDDEPEPESTDDAEQEAEDESEPEPEPEPDPEPEPEPAESLEDGPFVADASDREWTWDEVRNGEIETLDGVFEIFTGSGDDLIDLAVPWEFAIVDAQHTGSRNFIVRGQTSDGEGRGIVNAIGNYEGRIAANDRSELVGLNVSADGDWAIVVRNVLVAQSGALARSYEGTGDAVIIFPYDLDDPQPNQLFDRMNATHDGERNFILRELLGRGLINEIGPYDGAVRLPAAGLFGIEISADGNWTLELE